MLTDAPGEYPDRAAEAASFDIIARFAMAQEEALAAIAAYPRTELPPHLARQVERNRMGDEDRLAGLITVARLTNYPLHPEAYRATYRATKALRDRLAHSGPPMVAKNPVTGEPALWTFIADEDDPDQSRMHTHRLSELRAVVADARWLGLVAWRIRELITNGGMPTWVQSPSDLPPSSQLDRPADREGWGAVPVCPRGHGNVYGVLTIYGDAWWCAHCEHLRLRDDSQMTGDRSVLEPRDD